MGPERREERRERRKKEKAEQVAYKLEQDEKLLGQMNFLEAFDVAAELAARGTRLESVGRHANGTLAMAHQLAVQVRSVPAPAPSPVAVNAPATAQGLAAFCSAVGGTLTGDTAAAEPPSTPGLDPHPAAVGPR